MKTFETRVDGRLITLSMPRGDMLLESIQSAIDRLGIMDAVVVSGIGTLSRMRYHRVTTLDKAPREEYPVVEGPIELCAVQGVVAHGQPHLHITASDPDHVWCGHLEEGCEVLYLAEIVLLVMEGSHLKREKDEHGLNQLT